MPVRSLAGRPARPLGRPSPVRSIGRLPYSTASTLHRNTSQVSRTFTRDEFFEKGPHGIRSSFVMEPQSRQASKYCRTTVGYFFDALDSGALRESSRRGVIRELARFKERVPTKMSQSFPKQIGSKLDAPLVGEPSHFKTVLIQTVGW